MQAADEATLVQQLQHHPHTLADVPRARITHAMVDAALQSDEGAVRYVPKRLMTPARYAAALRQGVKTWAQIPNSMRSEEACAEQVRKAGGRLTREAVHQTIHPTATNHQGPGTIAQRLATPLASPYGSYGSYGQGMPWAQRARKPGAWVALQALLLRLLGGRAQARPRPDKL